MIQISFLPWEDLSYLPILEISKFREIERLLESEIKPLTCSSCDTKSQPKIIFSVQQSKSPWYNEESYSIEACCANYQKKICKKIADVLSKHY